MSLHHRNLHRLSLPLAVLLIVSLACSLPTQLGTPQVSSDQLTLQAVGTQVAMSTQGAVPSATEPGAPAATAVPEATATVAEPTATATVVHTSIPGNPGYHQQLHDRSLIQGPGR